MRIREYVPEDSAIIASWVDSEETKMFFSGSALPNFPVKPEDMNDFYNRVKSQRVLYPYVMIEKGQPVGHFFLSEVIYNNEPTARVDLVIVDNTRRGQGYGAILIKYAMELSRELFKTKKLMLDVFNSNEAGRICYEKVGFRKNGITHVKKFDWGEESIYDMEIEL